ncbi:MAG: hypothetical protein ABIT47_03225 [Candidatus Paceibacterota bacterium]
MSSRKLQYINEKGELRYWKANRAREHFWQALAGEYRKPTELTKIIVVPPPYDGPNAVAIAFYNGLTYLIKVFKDEYDVVNFHYFHPDDTMVYLVVEPYDNAEKIRGNLYRRLAWADSHL